MFTFVKGKTFISNFCLCQIKLRNGLLYKLMAVANVGKPLPSLERGLQEVGVASVCGMADWEG